MPDSPETPEGVALVLLNYVTRAEGVPLEELTETKKPARAGNQTVRGYLLDAFVECLMAAKGERSVGAAADGDGHPRRPRQ